MSFVQVFFDVDKSRENVRVQFCGVPHCFADVLVVLEDTSVCIRSEDVACNIIHQRQ